MLIHVLVFHGISMVICCYYSSLICVRTTASIYPLSKDVDVSMWLDFRKFNKAVPLPDTGDFAIVTSEVHNEFDKFKEKEIPSNTAYMCI